MRRRLKYALGALAVVASGVLLVSRQMNGRIPEAAGAVLDPRLRASPEITFIIQRSCADCHSDATRRPWYARVPPASWLVRRDVEHAQHAMNLSTLVGGQPDAAKAIGDLAAICRAVKSGRMPPLRYRLMHPNARLSAADGALLCEWTATQSRRLNGNALRE